MACDPQTLVTQAACLECAIPPGMQLPVLISLFCQILTNQSGASANNLVAYTVGNPASPPNPAELSIAYDPTGNLPTLGWNIATQTWN